MGLKDGENLSVNCPCCHAKLVVDPVFGAVLSHEAPPKSGPNLDLTDAQKILAEQNRQREDKFADSWFQESNKEDILAKKFEEAMKKAKDAPVAKPIRDFDLD
jgi:Zn-finger nucleic acid-binding protein